MDMFPKADQTNAQSLVTCPKYYQNLDIFLNSDQKSIQNMPKVWTLFSKCAQEVAQGLVTTWKCIGIVYGIHISDPIGNG